MKIITTLALIVVCLPTLAQPDTDIWVFHIEDSMISGDPIKITEREGYDNQPSFGGDFLYYTSMIDEQTDIFAIDPITREHVRITDTPHESEYSPTLTPDGEYISVIMVEKDGTQRLWKYHLIHRKREVVLFDLEPVGYHVWFTNYDLGTFVLGEPNQLYIANAFNGQAYALTDSIGRSLQQIPGAFGQFSFVQSTENGQQIMRSNGTDIEHLIDLPEDTEDFSWHHNRIVTGQGPKLLISDLENRSWIEWHDLSSHGIKDISRIAFHPEGKMVALVVER